MEPPVSRIGWKEEEDAMEKGKIDKIMQTRREIEVAKVIMKENVKKIMQRQQNLDELVERAQRLEASSEEYVKCAVRIQRTAHWRHYALQYSLIGATTVCCTVLGLVWTFM